MNDERRYTTTKVHSRNIDSPMGDSFIVFLSCQLPHRLFPRLLVQPGVPLDYVDQSGLDNLDAALDHVCERTELQMAAVCPVLAHAPYVDIEAPFVLNKGSIAGFVLDDEVANVLPQLRVLGGGAEKLI